MLNSFRFFSAAPLLQGVEFIKNAVLSLTPLTLALIGGKNLHMPDAIDTDLANKIKREHTALTSALLSTANSLLLFYGLLDFYSFLIKTNTWQGLSPKQRIGIMFCTLLSVSGTGYFLSKFDSTHSADSLGFGIYSTVVLSVFNLAKLMAACAPVESERQRLMPSSP